MNLKQIMIGKIDYEQYNQKKEPEITDSYQEMLQFPNKRLISLDLTNPKQLDLSKNIVVQDPFLAHNNIFNQLKKGKGEQDIYIGSLDNTQDASHLNQLAGSYKEMLQNKNMKLLTLGIDEKEIKNYKKYGYISQEEDPVFVKSYDNNKYPIIFELPIVKNNQVKEPILNYYQQQRLKMVKFFKKIQKKNFKVNEKEKNLLKEIQQYKNQIQSEINKEEKGDNNQEKLETLQSVEYSLDNTLNSIESQIKNQEQIDQIALQEYEQKLNTRVNKIEQFLKQATSEDKKSEVKDKLIQEISQWINSLENQQNEQIQFQQLSKETQNKIQQIKEQMLYFDHKSNQIQKQFRFANQQQNFQQNNNQDIKKDQQKENKKDSKNEIKKEAKKQQIAQKLQKVQSYQSQNKQTSDKIQVLEQEQKKVNEKQKQQVAQENKQKVEQQQAKQQENRNLKKVSEKVQNEKVQEEQKQNQNEEQSLKSLLDIAKDQKLFQQLDKEREDKENQINFLVDHQEEIDQLRAFINQLFDTEKSAQENQILHQLKDINTKELNKQLQTPFVQIISKIVQSKIPINIVFNIASQAFYNYLPKLNENHTFNTSSDNEEQLRFNKQKSSKKTLSQQTISKNDFEELENLLDDLNLDKKKQNLQNNQSQLRMLFKK